MANNILISGKPGSGKTTLVVKLVERIAADGFKTGGFVTEEIRKGSHRVGFEVRDLVGDTAVLAHIDYKGKPRVGKYGVDTEAFEGISLQALEIGKREADLLVIDEIGRMEMASNRFRSALLDIMEQPLPLLATVHIGRDEFTATILDRDDTTVFNISPSTRENLSEVIYESLKAILEDRGDSRKPEGGKRS